MSNIPRLNFISTIVSIVLVLGVTLYFLVIDKSRELAQNEKREEAAIENRQRALLQTEIEKVRLSLGVELAQTEENNRWILRENVEQALALERKFQNRLPARDFREMLASLRFHNGEGGYFLFTGEGRCLLHPETSPLSPDFMKKLEQAADGGFVTLSHLGKTLQAYVVRRSDGAYLGGYLPVDLAEREVESWLLRWLRDYRYGYDASGYFWLQARDGGYLMHPYLKEEEFTDTRTVDGVYPIREANLVAEAGGGYFQYKWPKPGETEPETKTSYATILEPLGWVMGTGYYLGDLEARAARKIAENRKIVQEDFVSALALLFLAFAFSLGIAAFTSRHIARVEAAERANLNLLDQYKKVLDESSYVTKSDLSGRVTYINKRMLKASGYALEEVMGKPHNIFRHPNTPKELFREMWEKITAKKTWRGVVKNRSKSGESFYAQTTIMPILDETGEIVEYIAARNDITELVENREQLRHAFHTDALTSLGNRFKLTDDLKNQPERMLALFNIDGFRQINDAYGSTTGDFVIIELGNRIYEAAVEKMYDIYRIQGDEYAVLGDADPEEFAAWCREAAEKMVEEPFTVHNRELHIRITVGAAPGGPDALIQGDLALKTARAKKSPFLLFDDSIKTGEEYQKNQEWIREINRAIKEERIVPYFQAIFNRHTQRIEKYEALVRLIDEKGEPVSPGQFLEVAKQAGLYHKLTRIMVEKSADVFAELPYEFSVNVTVEDILHPEVSRAVLAVGERPEIAGRMVLELVESEGIENYDEALAFIDRAKKRKIKVAIDDFGTGYSNFEYLLKLKADYIKIDGSLIKSIDKDPETRAVAETVVRFARSAGMKTIAEYVCSPEVRKAAGEIGADYFQGYDIAQPLPAEKIT